MKNNAYYGDKVLRVTEVASELNYSVRHIRELLQSGRIRGSKFNELGEWRVTRGELDRFKRSVGLHSEDKIGDSKSMEEKITLNYEIRLRERAKNIDEKTFKKAGRIISERELKNFLVTLELHYYYELSTYVKLIRLWDLLNLESNSYIDRVVRRLCEKLCDALNEIIIFLKLESVENQLQSDSREKVFQLAPADVKHTRAPSLQEELLKGHILKVRKLTKVCWNAYTNYRTAVRERLLI